MPLWFEQGPIRPPSEAQSLLIRLTRNCSWNKCLFCPVYKKQTFSRRSVQEIVSDLDTISEIIRLVQNRSHEMGYGGQINTVVAQYYFDQNWPQSYLSVVAWLYYGTGAVFLQDANTLIMSSDDLVSVLDSMNEKIEGITRVTCYARSGTAARKSVSELTRIRQAGLDRIHIGFETGYDPLLKFMKKGVTAAGQIKGGQSIKAAGMELSEYYMPGLGGRSMWKEHAVESARVLNAINPDFIRLRTLRIPERIELFPKCATGEFQQMSDDEVVLEIRTFIEHLEGITSFVSSDHIMNLLQNVEGRLPRDKKKMLLAIDRYLELDEENRMRYRLGRRMGQFCGVGDMMRPELMNRVDETLDRLKRDHPGQLDNILEELANKMI